VAGCATTAGALGIWMLVSGRPLRYYLQGNGNGTILGTAAKVINGGTAVALVTVLLVGGMVRLFLRAGAASK
jgi:hypothetical protein